jgi:nicotinamidase-related amidase
MAVWDDVIGPEDRAALEGEWGRRSGFGERPALLVVDVNYAFADDRFPLGVAHGFEVAERIGELLRAARAAQLPVIYTTGTPTVNQAERGHWKSRPRALDPSLPDPHAIVPAVAPLEHESVVRKRRPSGFFGTELASLLIHERVDTVIVTGLVTSGCIRATALDAFSHNFRVVIPEECVGDRSQLSHKVSLFDLHMKYGDVLPTADVIAEVERHGAQLAGGVSER